MRDGWTNVARSRKAHHCDGCHQPIEVGSSYAKSTAPHYTKVADWEPGTHMFEKMHPECCELLEQLMDSGEKVPDHWMDPTCKHCLEFDQKMVDKWWPGQYLLTKPLWAEETS